MALTYQPTAAGAVPYRAQGTLHYNTATDAGASVVRCCGLAASKPARVCWAIGRFQTATLHHSKGQGSEARFDAAAARVFYSHGGQAPLHPGVQDEISLYFAMAMALSATARRAMARTTSAAPRAASLGNLTRLPQHRSPPPAARGKRSPCVAAQARRGHAYHANLATTRPAGACAIARRARRPRRPTLAALYPFARAGCLKTRYIGPNWLSTT